MLRLGDLKLIEEMSEEENTLVVERRTLFDVGIDPHETLDLARRRGEEADRMGHSLEEQLDAARQRRLQLSSTEESSGLPPEVEAMLRAMGYLDDEPRHR